MLCARVSQENIVPEEKNFIRPRCAPMCLEFPKTFVFANAARPSVQITLFANAARPCVSGKESSGKPVCLRM